MKRKMILRTVLLAMVAIVNITVAFGQVGMGASLVSRYVWRGTDYGNSPSIQPGLSYAIKNIEIGASAAWSLTDSPGWNENDLYITASFGSFGLTLTDYFFPDYDGNDNFFDYGDEAGVHTLELSASYGLGALSIMGAVDVRGDADKSKYLEIGYELPASDGYSADLVVGLGDGFYTTDGAFDAVHVGVNVSKDSYSASYIINPDGETSFLVFGVSF
ncbi:MAG: hypothetical protein GXO92_02490 [FCB group bacterium]|nr:hypothetical protein [FCB group bacterium]